MKARPIAREGAKDAKDAFLRGFARYAWYLPYRFATWSSMCDGYRAER